MIERLGNKGGFPTRVTHNDTKLNNVMLGEDNKGRCVIDLDTVMAGYVHRTTAGTEEEDETDISKIDLDMEKFEAFANGYLDLTREILTATETKFLALSDPLFSFLMGIRFLTDYLSGDVYYKIDIEDHNLRPAKCQLNFTKKCWRNFRTWKELFRNKPAAQHIDSGINKIMKKGKILVTGGAGYIGSHTVVELISEGYEVIIVDDLSNSQINVLSNIKTITGVRPEFYQFNICDKGKLRRLIGGHKIEGIVHFAASKAVGESVEIPYHYYSNNIVSLLNLLDTMNEFNIHHIVFSSSCTVYGQPLLLPVTEKTPFQQPESPYANTKQIGEEILADGTKAYPHLHVIALRYFNPVGAHESALIGELPIGIPNHLFPFITQTAAGIRDQLKVFGGDYNTADGSAIRDYIHVTDLAKAHVVALQRMVSKKQKSHYEFFNIGTGKGYSVLEAIAAFERINNVKIKYEIVERRTGDIEMIYANTSLANNVLGWKAEKRIDEMVRSAWRWQKNTGISNVE